MLDKMKQLWEMKQKIEEIKKELDALVLATEDDLVKVSITGSQQVKSVELKCDLASADKEKLQASMVDTMNRAIKEAQKAAAEKMGALKGLPGM